RRWMGRPRGVRGVRTESAEGWPVASYSLNGGGRLAASVGAPWWGRRAGAWWGGADGGRGVREGRAGASGPALASCRGGGRRGGVGLGVGGGGGLGFWGGWGLGGLWGVLVGLGEG